VTISTIWEPIQDAADESGGGSGSRGRGGRRSSSIIAGRRPARRPDSAAETDEAKSDSSDSSESDEDRPLSPRRRRQTTAKAKETTAEKTGDSEVSEKPAPRRRRRTRSAEAEPAAEVTEAATKADEPVAEAPVAEEPAEASEPAAEVTVAPRRRTTTRRTSSADATAPDLAGLFGLVEQQGTVLNELRAGLLTLGAQLDRAGTKPRVGLFVDVPNLMYGQEPDAKPINMGKLLDFMRQGRDIVRATAYSPVSDNPSEPLEQQKFVAPFVPYEYRIVTKPLKRFADGSIKGNFDVEMAIDMLTMADGLDVIAIISGDADFARAVEVVQTRGVRVEVVAFARSSSLEMRSLADRYVELGAVIEQLV